MMWAQVTQVSPVRVQLNGDTSPLPYEPPTAIDAAFLALDDMVMVERVDSLYVIVGRAAGFTLPDASATVKGLAEFATDAETIAGTDDGRAVTPAGLKARLDEGPTPFREAAGIAVFPTVLANGGFTSVTVTFPVGRFTQVPVIDFGTNSARLTPQIDTRSTSSFRFGIGNFSGATASAGVGDATLLGFWRAAQMTPGSGAG